MNLLCGDCIDEMKAFPDNCVDSIVTDPPYGINFMGKKWDYKVPSVEVWQECLRILKPGGYLLSFAGTRTQHRMACNIEDAGFEIRDMIAWVYGSGFPISQNISKMIDKNAGAQREIVGTKGTAPDIRGNSSNGRGISSQVSKDTERLENYITAPATPEAKQWDGWGTALKPALEPITVSRKPLSEKTVAKNVLKYGTGGINIDGCRIETEDTLSFGSRKIGDGIKYSKCEPTTDGIQNPQGRFPANLIHDGSDEVLEEFPDTKSGAIKAGQSVGTDHTAGDISHNRKGGRPVQPKDIPMSQGSAARFFYCAKTSKKERREGNTHPTVKPLKLMKYLIRLVTPSNGTILDPFMGSGTSGIAAIEEGVNFIGIEIDKDYFNIAKKRIDKHKLSNSIINKF